MKRPYIGRNEDINTMIPFEYKFEILPHKPPVTTNIHVYVFIIGWSVSQLMSKNAILLSQEETKSKTHLHDLLFSLSLSLLPFQTSWSSIHKPKL